MILLCILFNIFDFAKSVKIYDAFTFNDEWDSLEIRVRTLADIVDVFVICESSVTFSGRAKPLYLTESPNFLEEFRTKFRIVNAKLRAREPKNSWNNEYVSRNALFSGMFDVAEEDWVLISDLDEIPRPENLLRLKTNEITEKSVGFPCVLFCYNYGWKADGTFGMPVAHRISQLRRGGIQSTAWRSAAYRFPINSCWHCSYCFGRDNQSFAAAVISKLVSFAHTEFSSGKYVDPEYILKCRNTGVSFFSGDHYTKPPIIDSPPIVMQDEKFRYLRGNE